MFDPEQETGFLMEAIRMLTRELGPEVPVLGFAAAATFACSVAYFTVTGLNLLSGLRLPPPVPVVSELVMTVLFYVPATLVVGWLHHKLIGAARSDV